MRASRSERARNCRSSSDGVSAACRSSSTRTMGCASLAARRKEAVESKSRTSHPPGRGRRRWQVREELMSSGSIWAMSAAPGANSSRIRSLSPSRICARRACTHGQYAGAPRPPSSGPSGPSPRAPGRATSVRPRAWSCRYRARRRSRTPTCAPRGRRRTPSGTRRAHAHALRTIQTAWRRRQASRPQTAVAAVPRPCAGDRVRDPVPGSPPGAPSAHVRVRCRAPRPARRAVP